jgi:hypothetical protein
MLDEAVINWDQGVFKFEDLDAQGTDALESAGFYALLAARLDRRTRKWVNLKLLYIGKAFNQAIRKRLPQDHSAFECIEEFFEDEDNQDMDLVVMVGTLVSATLERVTKQLFDDIEACLIFRNQPLCNVQSTESYSGRPLRVINEGDFAPLKPTSTIR